MRTRIAWSLFIVCSVFAISTSVRGLILPAHAQTSRLSASDLSDIASASGSLQLDASGYSAEELADIATKASGHASHGAQITLHNVGKFSGADLIKIAHQGKGCVTFVIDKQPN